MPSLASSPDVAPSELAEPERVEPHGALSSEPPHSGTDNLLDVSVWDQAEAVRAAANRELRSELVGASAQRVTKLVAFTGVLLLAYLIGIQFFLARDSDAARHVLSFSSRVLTAGVLLSGVLLGLTRVKSLRPGFITDLGYVYLFCLTLLLGLLRHAQPFAASDLVRQVSPVVIPILAFGALIPAAPRKALAVSLGAAAMDPLALFMLRRHLAYGASETALAMISPLLAALVAYQISRVVHRLSQGIAKAREVGSYRLVEQLGVGGMAEVWRAQHRMLARPAAVKLIRPKVLARNGPIDSERLLRLFAREARTTASLSSPHTIQVYDFGITREGAFYYVMELLSGIDLQSLVERFGPQPSERVAWLLRQACHSLAEAHERNFVHRDIKPANIFTCLLGGDCDFVKVLDFGLVLDRHPTSEELEDEQRLVGTPAVMPPEMVRFHAPVDARADIYALGCVGYWLLTGKRVFEASTRHDMLVMHAHQKPILPSKRVDVSIHAGLEAVVMSCLEKNPNRRPQTARELSELLGALSFSPAWAEERAWLWWKRYHPERRADPATPEGDEVAAASSPRAHALVPFEDGVEKRHS
ncbi:MAG TPA: serine/threonine-protein kinase [Polyangiaceae bacterium]|nr:serine/threonine-protein kinase [Polyangiaceae bacterium]